MQRTLCTLILALITSSMTFIVVAAFLGAQVYHWTPLGGALSDLGVYRATRPLFNTGVSLGALALTLYAASTGRLAWLIPAVALATVSTVTEDYGLPHFLAAAFFFTSPLVLLPRENTLHALLYSLAYAALVAAVVARAFVAMAEYCAALILALHVALYCSRGS